MASSGAAVVIRASAMLTAEVENSNAVITVRDRAQSGCEAPHLQAARVVPLTESVPT